MSAIGRSSSRDEDYVAFKQESSEDFKLDDEEFDGSDKDVDFFDFDKLNKVSVKKSSDEEYREGIARLKDTCNELFISTMQLIRKAITCQFRV
ncbi:unnamed protein product [Amaranthus hypochondriacus]